MSYQAVSMPPVTYAVASPSKSTNQGRRLASAYRVRGSPACARCTAGKARAVPSVPAAARPARWRAYSTSVQRVSVGLPSSTVPGISSTISRPASWARLGQASARAAASRPV
ncbi:hypothetical protein [Micromonospora sp. MH33]|uniref:hypothetical protein n=1 Tax=Micromonospora sp. MH33 TaxID=1945509 RepID=UPI00143D59C2|nr:hypothetical protein [Micromonospora sp. MH33]